MWIQKKDIAEGLPWPLTCWPWYCQSFSQGVNNYWDAAGMLQLWQKSATLLLPSQLESCPFTDSSPVKQWWRQRGQLFVFVKMTLYSICKNRKLTAARKAGAAGLILEVSLPLQPVLSIEPSLSRNLNWPVLIMKFYSLQMLNKGQQHWGHYGWRPRNCRIDQGEVCLLKI